ncbi:hypothetical protein BT96DRAFT_996525 [Gymnopus androsaceus JB14]|uniref:Uncharacterized protein n=1 Tax=Gymnopus androsaceus JB14 TaxID=1447944 RepID=A0A6A4HFU7_9AGAR|nr:hypothetical protein BT96DRAFT_996525 [Gymnopus androsaceus JB14]
MSRADVESVEIFKPASFPSAQQAGGTNLRQSRRGRERERKLLTGMNIVEILTRQRRDAKLTQRALIERRPGMRNVLHRWMQLKRYRQPQRQGRKQKTTANKDSRRPILRHSIGIRIPGRRLKAETPVEDKKCTMLGGVHTSSYLQRWIISISPVSPKIPDDVHGIRGR